MLDQELGYIIAAVLPEATATGVVSVAGTPDMDRGGIRA